MWQLATGLTTNVGNCNWKKTRPCYLPQDARTSNTSAVQYDLPIDSVDVFSQFKFQSCSQDDDGELSASEIVKANPKDGHFNTVVVLTATDAESTALQGTHIG
ncbi:uncharacterized protein LACBIDRAFT_335425 [Laccaria bicolor S238N-H82]|uniref:Predicted protein n=1 Tax=Laccaria bicolor (strain S238N-H82 / ATCC MYA-4686) TaxID=486041 RepID=B0E2A8_LACBS|nr:uncharacterized protein LACBIDRAFT_335425 [Laccaria bicolor S238N-H82]EDQ99023.1 predicted protein [Laccaria bicolor S238N-H82]|eukprot:XP_001890331.1 predicted protein [Laccaria bicolor S238N-H82]